MRIVDLLAVPEPSFSFEFFPPATDEGVEALFHTVEALRVLEPTFVSITYGAVATRPRTLDLVQRIKRDLAVETLAHLTCAGSTQDDLAVVLNKLHDGGVENVLCLRGDPPRGTTEFVVTEGGFRYARELTEFVKASWRFCLGTAGYPEKHPECSDRYTDLLHLKQKVDAGASFILTQLFYETSYYFEFVAQARRMGITVPIIPGIMPVTTVEQVERITAISGATIPDRLRRELATRRDDPNAALELGVAYATLQCAELLRNGAPGIHFYTLNRSMATRAILAALRAHRPWVR